MLTPIRLEAGRAEQDPVGGAHGPTLRRVMREYEAMNRLTERLRLEPIGVEHAADLYALFSDPAVAEWYGPKTRAEVDREVAQIARSWQVDGVHKWVAYHRESGELVGRGGLSRQVVDGRERLELGWALLGRFWRQGYASEIGRAGLLLAFGELGADEVAAFTETRNVRSRAVMERLGFRHDKDIRVDDEPFVLYLISRPPSLRAAVPSPAPER
jgi:ribosomal-protein-alanine N-acetyltransferase